MKSVFRGSAYIFRGVNWNIKPATPNLVVKRQSEILERLCNLRVTCFSNQKKRVIRSICHLRDYNSYG